MALIIVTLDRNCDNIKITGEKASCVKYSAGDNKTVYHWRRCVN